MTNLNLFEKIKLISDDDKMTLINTIGFNLAIDLTTKPVSQFNKQDLTLISKSLDIDLVKRLLKIFPTNTVLIYIAKSKP